MSLNINLDSKIWIDSFWFNLTTMAMYYPDVPNETIKKKYYEYVQLISTFFPVYPLGKTFDSVLKQYPVTPYLDSQPSFIQWVHFVYNKIMCPREDQRVTLSRFLNNYYTHFRHKEIVKNQEIRRKIRWLKSASVIGMFALVAWLYKK